MLGAFAHKPASLLCQMYEQVTALHAVIASGVIVAFVDATTNR